MNFANRHRTTSSIVRVLAALILLAGCASYEEKPPTAGEIQSYLRDKPPDVRPLYREVAQDGSHDYVLNQMRAGLAALDTGYFDLAEQSFEEAAIRIESIYADNPRAASARSLWYEEGMKEFKGEPYERAMTYYYLGLLYLRRGDFENARACFKNGILQDAFAEEEQNRCDFALLIFLEGWASHCLGDSALAEAAYEEVLRLRPDFQIPDPCDNLLLIAETGHAPRKLADGVGHYEMVYRRGKGFSENRAAVRLSGETRQLYPIEDIAWQAMTRGGRPIDRILAGQVIFKKRNEEIGTALSDVAANTMILASTSEKNQDELRALSLALGLVSVLPLAIASKIKPRADTRYWDNLPDVVHVTTLRAPTADRTLSALFREKDGNIQPSLSRTCKIHWEPARRASLAWTRSQSALLDREN
ncbi:hypothetical protein HQ520_01840 [bacterium]|nr:hypothetical protein [bacterium]